MPWTWPKVPVIWIVYQPPYSATGARVVFVRTVKALHCLTVNGQGETTHATRRNRPLTFEWKFDYEAFEKDFRAAMQKPWREKARWRQMSLALQWPPDPPQMIQLVFSWSDTLPLAA